MLIKLMILAAAAATMTMTTTAAAASKARSKTKTVTGAVRLADLLRTFVCYGYNLLAIRAVFPYGFGIP